MKLSRTIKTACLVGWLVFLALNAVFSGQAQAHDGGFPFRYVALNGLDQDDCDNPAAPCRTIQYAISRAVAGDQIRVASGIYQAHAADFMNESIPLKGGYQTGPSGFAIQDPLQNPTYLLGVDSQYQTLIEKQGFLLAKDLKSIQLPAAQSAPSQALKPLSKNEPTGYTSCKGMEAGPFPCQGIDLLARIPLDGLSSLPATANDIWGLVDMNNQREYALLGLNNGTAIIDVTNPVTPVEIATIQGLATFWRDIKTVQFFDAGQDRWRAYAYVTADNVNQGLQIIDLSELPTTATLTATYTGFSRAHNIYIGNVDYSTGVVRPGFTPFAYIMGSNLNKGRFRVLDVSNPITPVEVTAPPPGSGYAHDGSTMVISDSRTLDCAFAHNPCEIFIDFNESTVDLWDVTDKAAPFLLSSTTYAGAAYTHSGWPSQDNKVIFVQDELDELASEQNTRLRVLDVSDIQAPFFINDGWTGPTKATDHNGFSLLSHYYMSNYQRGMTILNVKEPAAPIDIAFFDTYPDSDNATWSFDGAWGVYPYLPSGTILVSDSSRGLFLLREQGLAIDNSGPDVVPPGSPITYTLTLTNNGILPATNVVITNRLPGGVTYLAGGENIGDVVSWTLASLASGATTTTIFTVLPMTVTTVANMDYGVTAQGSITNQAYIQVQGHIPVITRVTQEIKLYLPVILKAGIN